MGATIIIRLLGGPKAQPLPRVACATALMVPSPPAAITMPSAWLGVAHRFAGEFGSTLRIFDDQHVQLARCGIACTLDGGSRRYAGSLAGRDVEYHEKGCVRGHIRFVSGVVQRTTGGRVLHSLWGGIVLKWF